MITYPQRSSSPHARSSPAFPRITLRRDMATRSLATAAPTFPQRPTQRPRSAQRRADSLRTLGSPSSLDLPERLVENPDRRRRLLARQDERRREADRVLPGAEQEQTTSERRLNGSVALLWRAFLRVPVAHQFHANHQPAASHVAD